MITPQTPARRDPVHSFMHIVLIGLRGSGKSSVGASLASLMGRPWFDLDELTPSLMGCRDVRHAWETRGEPDFRACEARALSLALARPQPAVLSLGGGTPTAPGAADLLRDSSRIGAAWVVYLRLLPAALRARLAGADLSNRPSLTGASTLGEIDAIWSQRDPLYTPLADLIIEPASHESPDDVAHRISRAFPATPTTPTSHTSPG